MVSSLQQFIADHTYLRDLASRNAGIKDPVLVDLYSRALLEKATGGDPIGIDGVLIRTWKPTRRNVADLIVLGMRRYEIDNVQFAVVTFGYNRQFQDDAFNFIMMERADYPRLREIAHSLRAEPAPAPIMASDQAELLWKNTIGFLEPDNLEQFRRYSGRPQRGVLLSGAPGNGKTMACRWIWNACCERGWACQTVTPDQYHHARKLNNVEGLFQIGEPGVIVFDDMDQFLRNREGRTDTEDQTIFLTGLDGIHVKKAVVFIFTTNCALDQIDPAFKRPGRIDVFLRFEEPNTEMRRQFVLKWHPDILAQLDEDSVVASTDGYSFAELDEIKNLLISGYVENQTWDWHRAIEQLAINREQLRAARSTIGFSGTKTAAAFF